MLCKKLQREVQWPWEQQRDKPPRSIRGLLKPDHHYRPAEFLPVDEKKLANWRGRQPRGPRRAQLVSLLTHGDRGEWRFCGDRFAFVPRAVGGKWWREEAEWWLLGEMEGQVRWTEEAKRKRRGLRRYHWGCYRLGAKVGCLSEVRFSGVETESWEKRKSMAEWKQRRSVRFSDEVGEKLVSRVRRSSL
ncbi:hypothetical protein LTS18_014223 [Coniosporium uncinatum]|uniref:Uncharacterized protein n=1 Tax=Coniosporium uncinatum TaxID=93489 RepID=A0ACC3DVH2_9PEZI|nr:hypothetical protein LTS18_014223 [Coniosporium uncinatum]